MLKGVLTEYESVSRQCINFIKSTVFYGSNTRDQEKDDIAHFFRCSCFNECGKIFGLPKFNGERKEVGVPIIE